MLREMFEKTRELLQYHVTVVRIWESITLTYRGGEEVYDDVKYSEDKKLYTSHRRKFLHGKDQKFELLFAPLLGKFIFCRWKLKRVRRLWEICKPF
jgi:hypothetical protein